MKNELRKILDNFYELSEFKAEQALTSILELANAQPMEFTNILRDLKPDDISIIYEALGNDLDNWNEFFLEELKRIIETAKKADNPNTILSYLDEFIFIEPGQFKYRKELISILKKELSNRHPTFRYYAITVIADFIEDGDFLTIKLLEKHLIDTDWRIRYWTYVVLKEIKKSNNYKLSFIDKIRSKIFDPFKFD